MRVCFVRFLVWTTFISATEVPVRFPGVQVSYGHDSTCLKCLDFGGEFLLFKNYLIVFLSRFHLGHAE
jgi:hypothetical protein